MDKVAVETDHAFRESVFHHPRRVSRLPSHFVQLLIPITFDFYTSESDEVIKIVDLIHSQTVGRFFINITHNFNTFHQKTYLLVGLEEAVEVTYFCLLLSGLNIQAEEA